MNVVCPTITATFCQGNKVKVGPLIIILLINRISGRYITKENMEINVFIERYNLFKKSIPLCQTLYWIIQI